MRILFDHDTLRPLRRYLTEHTVDTANEKGWAELRNGNLLPYRHGPADGGGRERRRQWFSDRDDGSTAIWSPGTVMH